MTGTAFRCFYCNDPIPTPSRRTWTRCVGWERKADTNSRRGGSDIVLRERLHEFACDSCVFRLQRGMSVGQGEML